MRVGSRGDFSWIRPPGTGIITSEIKHVSLPTHTQAINTRAAAAWCGGRSGSRGSVVGAWGDSRQWGWGLIQAQGIRCPSLMAWATVETPMTGLLAGTVCALGPLTPFLQLHSWPLYDSGPSLILSQPGVESRLFIGSRELSDA